MHGSLDAAIRQRNERRFGTDRFRIVHHLGNELHVGTFALVAELVQNAEDAEASVLGLRVLEKGMLVWNDGRPFEDSDVEAITGLFITAKDPSAIGYFGIGFKVVLHVTDRPHILSGSHQKKA